MFNTEQEKFIDNLEDLSLILKEIDQIQGITYNGEWYFVQSGNNHSGGVTKLRIEDGKILDDEIVSSYMS